MPEVESSDIPVFASYKQRAIQPAVPFEQPAIASDLSNVYNPFVLSEDQLKRLGEDDLVVSPGVDKEFFTVYEQARYDNVPIFVTSDSLLHVYHLLFDKALRTAERKYFIPLLRGLNKAMLAGDRRAVQGAARHGLGGRGAALGGLRRGCQPAARPTGKIPAYADELVDAELALIEAAGGMHASPIFPGLEYGEDYTQYIPRGHYTLDEGLKAYFKSMMWYGRMTFRLKTTDPEVGKAGDTRRACCW